MAHLKSRFGPAPAEVAGRIRAERERLGLTQAECARRLGINRQTYLAMESIVDAKANPQLSALIALREACGFDPRAIAPELF